MTELGNGYVLYLDTYVRVMHLSIMSLMQLTADPSLICYHLALQSTDLYRSSVRRTAQRQPVHLRPHHHHHRHHHHLCSQDFHFRQGIHVVGAMGLMKRRTDAPSVLQVSTWDTQLQQDQKHCADLVCSGQASAELAVRMSGTDMGRQGTPSSTRIGHEVATQAHLASVLVMAVLELLKRVENDAQEPTNSAALEEHEIDLVVRVEYVVNYAMIQNVTQDAMKAHTAKDPGWVDSIQWERRLVYRQVQLQQIQAQLAVRHCWSPCLVDYSESFYFFVFQLQALLNFASQMSVHCHVARCLS